MVAAETVAWFKLELDRYREALQIEGYIDIGKIVQAWWTQWPPLALRLLVKFASHKLFPSQIANPLVIPVYFVSVTR